ncbi:MAG: choice-of-anchor Q domain-containing protein [Chloroflexota bacterium]
MKCRLVFIAALILFLWFSVSRAPIPVMAAGIVGNGSAGSCTLADLNTKLAGGGLVKFNCGTATIAITSTLNISTTTTIDGEGKITLDGGGAHRIILHTSAGTPSTLTLQNLTIANGYVSGASTAANGAGVMSVYQGTTPTLIVNNVTFSNNVANLTSYSGGAGDYGGGAIFSQGGFVTVNQSYFTGNKALGSGGGAIHGLRSDITVTNSSFYSNGSSGGHGGAFYADGAQNNNNGKIIINGSYFTNNTSFNEGGAIHVHLYQNNDALTIDRSSFIGNVVNGGTDGQGGALSGGNGAFTITNSLFSGNAVQKPGNADGSGGAIAINETALVTIANSTFTGNRANGNSYNANGGGIYIVNNTQPFTIINSTIARNYAGWAGGGISSGTNGILRNTIVAYNTANNGGNTWQILQQCSAQLTNGGNNLQYPPKNPNPNYYNEVICANNIPAIDPQLGALANYGGPTQTISLLPSSPAINAGSNTVCNAAPISGLDQRGLSRPIGSACDMGAFEWRPSETIGIFRPSSTAFYLRNSNSSGNADLALGFGASTDKPVVGDWTGSGIKTIGIYRNGLFLLPASNMAGAPVTYSFALGIPGDIPFSGRWTAGALHDGVGVFRPSNGLIYLKNNLTTGYADFQMVLGIPGDVPIAGDWNGDGIDSPGVFRPSTVQFYLSNQVCNCNATANYIVGLGISGDSPFAGDWNGTGITGIGVFRPSNGLIYLKNGPTVSGFADQSFVFGIPNDVPLAGRWATGPAIKSAPETAPKLAPTFVP